MQTTSILDNIFWGNTLLSYGISVLGGILGCGAVFVIDRIVFGKLKSLSQKLGTHVSNFCIQLFEKTLLPLLYFGVFYFAMIRLHLCPSLAKTMNALGVIVLTLQAVRFIQGLFVLVFEGFWLGRDPHAAESVASKSVVTVVKVVFWGLGFVFVLDNLGFNISAVVAGLGIGGVAVAFAAQTILGDLFNYFVIFFDRPFEEGDFIIVGEHRGTIERIGLKTTRIRSLDGEQIIVSNSDLTSSRVRNYKRMERRRVLYNFGVTYGTSAEKLKKIPAIIKEILRRTDKTIIDRVHFSKFGDYSLEFEVVYFVLSSDYNIYMDTQEKINLEMVEAFKREGIEFAFPTQTVIVERGE
ncbi:MAG: mechanosensitive ion channel family protein [Candidatus Omnitrophota bacterium]